MPTVESETTDVLMTNVALLAPAGTVTLPGTEAAGFALDNATAAPPKPLRLRKLGLQTMDSIERAIASGRD